MEPVSVEPRRRGRKGSLDNPEVIENVPGHVIPILEREFDDFDNEAERFLGGETAEEDFIGFRLRQGVYGQRQADVQMVRVKLPFGGITPEQMEAIKVLLGGLPGGRHHAPGIGKTQPCRLNLYNMQVRRLPHSLLIRHCPCRVRHQDPSTSPHRMMKQFRPAWRDIQEPRFKDRKKAVS